MLCWNRDPVYAVWLLPGGESAIPLGCSYRNLTGNPRAAGICTFFDPDWLVPGGCLRDRILLAKNEKSVEKIRNTKYNKASIVFWDEKPIFEWEDVLMYKSKKTYYEGN